jgi:methionyl-tRNA formyltransferase
VLRIIFMGTPDFAVPTLSEIIGAGHEVVAAYTRASKPAGRGMDLTKTPVHRLADGFGIPVFTPATLRDAPSQEIFESHGADVAVVVAYGMILPPEILAAPAEGCLNLHASLLPRWRGAAPINRAVMAGDAETGIGVMQMEAGLDTGPVGMEERTQIGPDETAGEVHDRLARLGADLMHRALGAVARGALTFRPQPEEGVTYAHKLSNAETRVDWSRPAHQLHNHIRGLSPYPGAWCEIDLGRGPERVKLLRSALGTGFGAGANEAGTLMSDEGDVACGEGALRLIQVQRAGKGPMAWDEFRRGARLEAGARLT